MIDRQRWRKYELYFYVALAAIIMLEMIRATWSLSSESSGNYSKFKRRLCQGWIGSRLMDNSDIQYASFRNNLLKLTFIFALYCTLSHLIRYGLKKYMLSTYAPQRFLKNPSFSLHFTIVIAMDLGVSIILFVFHGVSLFKIVVIWAINYIMTKKVAGQKWAPILFWSYAILILVINEYYSGVPYSKISRFLAHLDDGFEGVLPRWETFFKFSVLRMLSFSLDYHWSLSKSSHSYSRHIKATHSPTEHIPLSHLSTPENEPSTHAKSLLLDQKNSTLKRLSTSASTLSPQSVVNLNLQKLQDQQRVQTSLHEDEYCFMYYYAYCSYLPLYLAGPILTYNDFHSQLDTPIHGTDKRSVIVYGVRLLCMLLLMELMLHAFHVVAISKDKAWHGFTPFQLSMVAYWNLKLVWLKLLIIWRFFRFWALLDGFNAPENMTRCMSHNYSALDFWKHWHRSYNKWIVRYLYIPLGGKKTRIWNMFIIFTFVAIWHDITLKLLAWGWLISVFILPEVLAKYFTRKYKERPWYNHLAAFGAVFNILLMMTGNSVGFALNIDGTLQLWNGIVGAGGVTFVLGVFSFLYACVHLMFWYEAHVPQTLL